MLQNGRMWLDDKGNPIQAHGGIGVAVSTSPTDPFELLYTTQPNKQDSRDMTVFIDQDDTAYLVHNF